MNEVATRWLEQANEDLATAQILLDSGRFGPCAFYCQEEHYMRPRYPDARPATVSDYDEDTAQEALKNAQTVLAFARKWVTDAGESADSPTASELG